MIDEGDLPSPKRPRLETNTISGGPAVIECSWNGSTRIFSEYFGGDVEVFSSTSDPLNRPLFRASLLASKAQTAVNVVTMWLSRRQPQEVDGLFQATAYLNKPRGRVGLKAGAYFVSVEVSFAKFVHFCFSCRQFVGLSDV